MAAEATRVVDRERIVAALERAPQLAERLAAEAPFASPDAAVERARRLLAGMSEAERIAVLDAHPRIGADPASLSVLSRREQGAEAQADVLRELARLNEDYERRFGFRFVVFVAGRPKSEIVPVMRSRLERTRDEELRTGTQEFLAITRDRLSRS